MLQNAYLDTKFRFDTAENEPGKEWCVVANRRGLIWAQLRRSRSRPAGHRNIGRLPSFSQLLRTEFAWRVLVVSWPLARLKRTPLPPRSENQGFRRNYFNFFGNPLTPNSSKFEISPKFCEAFFNPVKFRQIFIKICSKTREIDSKFAKNDEIWWEKLQKYKRKIDKYLSVERCKGRQIL